MAFSAIKNMKLMPNGIATAGQPNEKQLREIGTAGYEVVINLGLTGTDYAVPTEEAILSSRDVAYYHLPVSFQTPEPERYRQFAQLLRALKSKKVFVHCAANKRVSVFMALFDILENGVPEDLAWENVLSVWDPDDVWERFFYAVLGARGRVQGE